MSLPPLDCLLRYQPPWSWSQFHAHYALRALSGVECLDAQSYARSAELDGHCGWWRVTPLEDVAALRLEVSPSLAPCLPQLALRVRRMFDLDAEPLRIAAHFSADPYLADAFARRPGLRLPSAFDPFEQAIRAIVGQQVSVKAAVTLATRLVQRLGRRLPDATPDSPQWLFPDAPSLASADLSGIGMPGRRVQTLQHFAAEVAAGHLQLNLDAGSQALAERLRSLPGIGPWTADYIALRAFGEADAFPAADLGLLKSPVWQGDHPTPRELARRAEGWRPWRGYAAVQLWYGA
ncbi:MAG: DNA-3-methyladenine glycosylase [Gammaproteobacteria bacterium]|nr:DNA-3-methyladenine glycosylase [Gammaproteobacteria bacterium]MBU1491154.1 DNA-3-methyladenine glycosylase [Gammaproteobacteria bacterium]MBU2065919.1 DNA-3-methyladenine glycosylase [Gammaproteobacteria bacterium]MBU2141245.1 DNA-3-methyladenine glycosylase [Gammaproteobacteria bacterium]MBU2215833.1 DNA-3-methyladenine glycosylase [Gammaproteobacteria bacterium]